MVHSVLIFNVGTGSSIGGGGGGGGGEPWLPWELHLLKFIIIIIVIVIIIIIIISCQGPASLWVSRGQSAHNLSIIYLLKDYNPINRTGSPQGFPQV